MAGGLADAASVHDRRSTSTSRSNRSWLPSMRSSRSRENHSRRLFMFSASTSTILTAVFAVRRCC